MARTCNLFKDQMKRMFWMKLVQGALELVEGLGQFLHLHRESVRGHLWITHLSRCSEWMNIGVEGGGNGEKGYVSGAPPAAPTLLVFPPLPSFSFLVKYNSC